MCLSSYYKLTQIKDKWISIRKVSALIIKYLILAFILGDISGKINSFIIICEGKIRIGRRMSNVVINDSSIKVKKWKSIKNYFG